MTFYHPALAKRTIEHMDKKEEQLRDLLLKCQQRLFGQGPSTDPLYAEIRAALCR